eukprot:scaffold136777_cov21-Tisochrysis_lutea.AAC.1
MEAAKERQVRVQPMCCKMASCCMGIRKSTQHIPAVQPFALCKLVFMVARRMNRGLEGAGLKNPFLSKLK